MRIAFVHFADTRNVGDLQSGPYHHFLFEGDISVHDVKALPAGRWDAVVFGGGAMGALLTKPPVRRWLARVPRRVAWGVGRSVRGATGPQPVPFEDFDLYGTREYPSTSIAYFVPCASCMSPLFSLSADPCREAVLFYNARKPKPDVELPSLSNEASFPNVVDHLLSGEVVVTNSYHGAYWATLLGRRVVIVGAYSSKFTCYPWPIPVRTDSDWRASLPEARVMYNALAVSRNLNRRFYESVKEVLYA